MDQKVDPVERGMTGSASGDRPRGGSTWSENEIAHEVSGFDHGELEPEELTAAKKGDQSWMEWVAGDSYEEAWKAIIRPYRDTYSEEQLGPAKFSIKGQRCRRKDVKLRNMNGHTLECSHFFPGIDPDLRWPCVVYLHGNSSSRLEAHDVLKVCLPRNLSVFCFDFAGSGRSEGEYVSLGHEEQKDLVVVLRYLRTTGMATSIGLWGRSMGASTAVLRAGRDHCLGACVLDSPFTNIRLVAEELVNSRLSMPRFMLDMGIEAVRGEVKMRAEFDIDDVKPIVAARKARCPAFFGSGVDDDLVLPHHSQDLCDTWGGEDRTIRTFDGGHNDRRPAWFMHEAADWLVMKLDRKDFPFEAVPLQMQDVSLESAAVRPPPTPGSSRSGYPSQDGQRSQFYLGKNGPQALHEGS